jgi:hypothetical protein
VDDLIAEGHRSLVFSQFTEMLRAAQQQANQKSIQYMSHGAGDRSAVGEQGPPGAGARAGVTGSSGYRRAREVSEIDRWAQERRR